MCSEVDLRPEFTFQGRLTASAVGVVGYFWEGGASSVVNTLTGVYEVAPPTRIPAMMGSLSRLMHSFLFFLRDHCV